MDEQLTPWTRRPRRRVATALGTARAPDEAVAGDEKPDEHPSNGSGRGRAFRTLEPVHRAASRWSGTVHLATVLLVAAAVVWTSETLRVGAASTRGTTAAASWLASTGLPDAAIDHWLPAISSGLLVLATSLTAAAVAGGLAASLSAIAVGWWLLHVDATVTPADLAGVAALGLVLTWWRRGGWGSGIAAGLATALLLVDPGLAAMALVLPAVALAAWAPRRPLASVARAGVPTLLAAVVGAGLVAAASASPAPAAMAGWWRDVPKIPPDTLLVTPWIAAAGVLAAGALLVRQPMGLLVPVAIAGGVWWSAGRISPVPIAIVGAVFGLEAAYRPTAAVASRVARPLVVAVGTALFAFAVTPAVPPDPTPQIEASALATRVADRVPPGTSVAVVDDRLLAEELADHRELRLIPDVDRADVLLVRRLDERRLRRQLGVADFSVLLRHRELPRPSGRGHEWLLVTRSGSPSPLASTRPGGAAADPR